LWANPDLKIGKGANRPDLGIRYYLPGVKIVASVSINYFNDLVSLIPGQFEGRPAYVETNGFATEARM